MKKIEVLISEEEIKKIIKEISAKILKDAEKNKCRELNFITVLEGARRFSEVLRKIIFEETKGKLNINNYNIKISSYQGTESRKLKLEKEIKENLKKKNVIVIEDIIDTGKTMLFLKNYLLKEKRVASLKIASLLSKPSRRIVDVKISYLGKEIPDVFVIGYGLDKDGQFRDLNYIGFIK